jgi:hypothetical protein
MQSGVVVNGRALDAAAIAALKQTYGTEAAPGNYWYDPECGLFGPVGRAGAGFMRPGHDFGPLDPAASAGTTGVFLNGRQLPLDEYMFFANLAGSHILPGRYWLNARGDVGIVGMPVALGNLVVAIQSRMAAGAAQSGGGDNFWYTRFSAGNSTADGSAGYVSLPGGGFATYGM